MAVDLIAPVIPCLIDDVLPTNNVHLLGGVSDAGKTRWVLPAMLDWERGLPVLGRASHPVPWAYVIGDRALHEAERTMMTMGIDPTKVRVIPAFGKHRKSPNEILLAAQRMDPIPQLLVWEGFQDAPPGERKQDVQTFLSSMTAYCEGDRGFPQGLTVLGIVESPKLKPNERYPNPRQRISGVSAWGYHSSTIILIESIEGDPSFQLPHRVMWVCMKNAKRRKLAGVFDQYGKLITVDGPVVTAKKSRNEPLKMELPTL